MLLARFLRRGISSFQSEETSCLILDVQMKGLSGIELQQQLIGEGRRTPIIFITAVLDKHIRKQVLEAGAIDILSKPFNDETLARCLVSALSKEEAPAGGDGASRNGCTGWGAGTIGSRLG